MSEPIQKAKSRAHLRVIEGGLSEKVGETASPSLNYFESRGSTPCAQEENRLRFAILNLVVEEIGMSVEQILQEISDKIDSAEDADFARAAFIKDQLEAIGLRFCLARPEMNLIREGYLLLAWPSRLLSEYPELKPLHPLSHQSLALG